MSLSKFQAAAVIASAASANFQQWTITQDGVAQTKYLESQPWSTIDIGNGYLYSDPNNNIYVQDAPSADAQSAYRPNLMGGSI